MDPANRGWIHLWVQLISTSSHFKHKPTDFSYSLLINSTYSLYFIICLFLEQRPCANWDSQLALSPITYGQMHHTGLKIQGLCVCGCWYKLPDLVLPAAVEIRFCYRFKNKTTGSWLLWHMPVLPALRRLRLEDMRSAWVT